MKTDANVLDIDIGRANKTKLFSVPFREQLIDLLCFVCFINIGFLQKKHTIKYIVFNMYYLNKVNFLWKIFIK